MMDISSTWIVVIAALAFAGLLSWWRKPHERWPRVLLVTAALTPLSLALGYPDAARAGVMTGLILAFVSGVGGKPAP